VELCFYFLAHELGNLAVDLLPDETLRFSIRGIIIIYTSGSDPGLRLLVCS